MSFFVKNHKKFDPRKMPLHHYDFFAISNVLTGAPKNAKICLYCIGHGKPSFLGNFFYDFSREGQSITFTKNTNFAQLTKNMGLLDLPKCLFIKILKSDNP